MIGGAVVGLLCAILLVMFIVYRMRKKDEGSYSLDEPKRSTSANPYARGANKEFYAWIFINWKFSTSFLNWSKKLFERFVICAFSWLYFGLIGSHLTKTDFYNVYQKSWFSNGLIAIFESFHHLIISSILLNENKDNIIIIKLNNNQIPFKEDLQRYSTI